MTFLELFELFNILGMHQVKVKIVHAAVRQLRLKQRAHIRLGFEKTAGELVNIYGASFEYLGKYKDGDVYIFKIPSNEDTGFPFVYLCDNENIIEITGFEDLYIIRLFVND